MRAPWKGWVFAGWGLALVILSSLPSQAQFSNEWINFSQPYYKIPVSKSGIYRISQTDLIAAGVPIGSIDPRRINLYHRGVEQAIFIQGQADAVFDPADFIEFYGQRNDGTLDIDLYSPGSSQPHSYYNLYSDTAAYFLTWNPMPVPGKRMTSFFEVNSSGLPKETSHSEERIELYAQEYSGGYTIFGEMQNTAFDAGEGWTGPIICTVSSGCLGQQDFVVDNLVRGVTSGSAPNLEILLAGRGEMQHQAEIYGGINGGLVRLLTTSAFTGFGTVKLNIPLAWTDIGSDGKMTVRVRLAPTGSRDAVSVSYVKVTFLQDYNLNSLTEKYFHLTPNANNKSYVEFQNSPAGARIWDVTDADNAGIILSSSVSGGIGAIIPTTSLARNLLVSSTILSTSLKKISFRPLPSSISDFIIISHRSLMKPALGYSNAVQAYAAYRASPEGGSYDTLSVPMDQLYDQFNYGETSPRAIYQFMKYLTAGGNPKFLFLLGKGLEVSQGFFRKTSLTPTDLKDLVPSAGMPGADMAFTAGLDGTTYEPAVPTGRLTASTPLQVAAYLNKVKETEALLFDNLWRKDILHLSGGIYAGEPPIFRQYVDGFKNIAEGYFLGGKAETISKQTLNVELINVKDQVNKGLNLVTFYGHSGPGTIDIDIGYVSDPTLGYQNAGKYPGFLINGCNAGRFFDNRVTFGEDWMLTPNKGAKAFIAHSSFGFTGALKQYTELFYSVAFGDSTFMKKGIGEVQKEVGRRYVMTYGSSLLSATQIQQMMLLGDPAVQLFGAGKTDYEVNNGSVSVISLDGKSVTAQSDSFAIQVRVRNFGRAQPGPLKIRVVRTLGNNTTKVYDFTFSQVLYQETLQLVIRKKGDNEFGSNSFKVSIDPDATIAELTKANNNATIGFFIPLNGTRNLFPAGYAIVNGSNVNLTFQNTDLLSGTRSYKIEVDTAATFDSPFLNRKDITAKVVAKFPLSLLPEDSLVYYWRTKLKDPLPGESSAWSTSSFARISNSPEGWTQMKFPQLAEDDTVGIERKPITQQLKFIETKSTVAVTTYGNANPAPFTQVSLKINGEEFNVSSQGQPCRNNTLNLIAFDKISTAPYAGIPFNFSDPRSCGREPQMINSFLLSELETGTNDLAQWVQNIKPSDSVVIFSIGDAGYTSWSVGVKAQLDQLGIGVSQMSGVQAGEPFVIFGRKGSSAGTANVFRPAAAPANAQQLTVSKNITGRFAAGSLSSVVIGPALQWSQFSSQLTGAGGNDQFGVDVFGIDLLGNETLLKSQLIGTQSLTDVNSSLFPYMKLRLQTKDAIDLTPVQLRRWQVTFVPLAEGILTYAGSSAPLSVKEGQEWKSTYGFANISNRSFSDSLTVNVDVFSAEKFAIERQTFRIKPPPPGDTTKFAVAVKTKGKGGNNDVTVFVNPHILPEPYFDNNVLSLFGHLQVEADRAGPVLDVTIDGRRVVNGDVVSSSPQILARVIDRNPFLLKTDTVGVELFLQRPCGALNNCPYTRINFSQPDVKWKPATATEEFEVLYQPGKLELGQYVLKVSATDANGNASGDIPYEVSFHVNDKATFSLKSVYPNPSSEIFYFKFAIEGTLSPDGFLLELFSSTGTPVRTFGREALELLHVGTNELAVQARDANGSLLPVGIYLFRLALSVDGKRFTKSGRLMIVR